jgi:hypothetical protein
VLLQRKHTLDGCVRRDGLVQWKSGEAWQLSCSLGR